MADTAINVTTGRPWSGEDFMETDAQEAARLMREGKERLAAPKVRALPRTKTVAAQAPPTPRQDERTSATRIVIDRATLAYRLGVTTDGEPIACPRDYSHPPILLGAKGGALARRLRVDIFRESRMTISGRAMDEAMATIIGLAHQLPGQTPMSLRCNYLEGTVVIDLGVPNSTRCAVITADGWQVEDRTPQGLFFRRSRATWPLPDPTRGGTLDQLGQVLGMSGREWDLVRGWLVVSVLPHVARPLLAFLAPAGAGKSTRARMLVNVLDPRAELGSDFGRSIGDDQVKALGRYIVAYDNVRSISDAMSDHICRLVTGDSVEKRALYSDGELFSIVYRRTGVLTAISLPALRPDALERVIPISLEQIPPEERTSEARLDQRFAMAHPQILGALCDAIAGMLARLPALLDADPPGPRMKDYWLALQAFDPTCAQVYQESTHTVMADAAADDPFVCAIRDWLDSMPDACWSGPAADAWKSSQTFQQRPGNDFYSGQPWWPNSPRGFSAALTQASGPLRAIGISVKRSKVDGRRVLTLRCANHNSGGGQ